MRNIAGIEIGAGRPCRFVAEIGNAHNGEIKRAKKLIAAAKFAGADFAKFQAYTPEELITLRGDGPAPEPWGAQGWTMRALYEKAQTPREWFPALFDYARHVGIAAFSSVFGEDSLAMLEACGCPAYKLAALDFGKTALRRMVEQTGKPVIRSCPMPTAPAGAALKLYCPPGYPQRVLKLATLRNGYDGFSYHGSEPVFAAVAVACGARMIEAHLQLAAEPSELEADVSLTEFGFATAVGLARQTEDIL